MSNETFYFTDCKEQPFPAMNMNPFTDLEAQQYISNIRLMPNVTNAVVTNWYNDKTKEFSFGLCYKVAGEYYPVCIGNRAVIFKDKRAANKAVRIYKSMLKAKR